MAAELVMLALYQQVQAVENADRRNKLKLYRRQLRDSLNAFEIPENSFRQTFRLSREAARFVIESLGDNIRETKIASGIPASFKVLYLFKCLSLVIEVPTLIVPPCQCFSTH
jgi:hypothetical protein